MQYTAGEIASWLNNYPHVEISDIDLKFAIRQRWNELYRKVRRNEIPNKEYAQRRRAYENIIWELGGLSDEFFKYKQKLDGQQLELPFLV